MALNLDTMTPIVSVVIPSFNRAELIGETLNSVRAQTLPDWEAIIVDDGSTDGTMEILRQYESADPRIRIFSRNRLPKGANTCRNSGLSSARGKYIVFLDSDDLLAPTCLESRTSAVQQKPAADFAVFQSLFFHETPGDLDRLVNADNGDSHFCRFLRGDPVWNTSSPVWKRIALEKLGGFDEKLSCWHDVEIHQRALIFGLEYESYLAHAPDVFVRCHSKGSVSQDGYKTREAIGSIFMVYGKAAQVLASSINPAIKAALRQMLAHAMRQALKYRFFDLARAGIVCGKKDRLLNPFHRTIWGIACLAHFARAQGFRGGARLGENLMKPFQPQISVGKYRYAKCPPRIQRINQSDFGSSINNASSRGRRL